MSYLPQHMSDLPQILSDVPLRHVSFTPRMGQYQQFNKFWIKKTPLVRLLLVVRRTFNKMKCRKLYCLSIDIIRITSGIFIGLVPPKEKCPVDIAPIMTGHRVSLILGAIWGRHDPGGSYVGPMNFVIWGSTLKRKCRHFDEIFITVCTGSCHFDNFQCCQWW